MLDTSASVLSSCIRLMYKECIVNSDDKYYLYRGAASDSESLKVMFFGAEVVSLADVVAF